jgi:hypothetical protein
MTDTNCKTGYGQRWKGSVRKDPDSERAVEVKSRKTLTDYRQRAEKMDREFAVVATTPRNAPQGLDPFVGKLSSFETSNVIPVACGNFGEVNQTASRLLCVLAKRAAMCSDTSELVPSTAGAKQRYSFLIPEWRRALSVSVTRGFASLKLCRIPFVRSTVSSAVC